MTAMENMRARLKAIADEREALGKEYNEIAAALVVVERFSDDETVTQLRPLPLRARAWTAPLPVPEPDEELDKDDLTKNQQAVMRLIFAVHPTPLMPRTIMSEGPDEMDVDQHNAATAKLQALGLIKLIDSRAWGLTDKGYVIGAALTDETIPA